MSDITFKADPAVISQKASEFEGHRQKIMSTIENMTSKVKGLQFEGEAGAAYQSKYAQLSDDIDSINKTVGEYSKDLQEIASNIQTVAASLTSTIDVLPIDIIK